MLIYLLFFFYLSLMNSNEIETYQNISGKILFLTTTTTYMYVELDLPETTVKYFS